MEGKHMKRARIERLKEIFDKAFGVMRHEWDFGEFTAQNEADEKEAAEIFAELLREATP
jgi:hypothetical protein